MFRILLTNDDGIDSPGLWAAAAVLAELGQVYVVAPREQWSGAGRSFPPFSDGRIELRSVSVARQDWPRTLPCGPVRRLAVRGITSFAP